METEVSGSRSYPDSHCSGCLAVVHILDIRHHMAAVHSNRCTALAGDSHIHSATEPVAAADHSKLDLVVGRPSLHRTPCRVAVLALLQTAMLDIVKRAYRLV